MNYTVNDFVIDVCEGLVGLFAIAVAMGWIVGIWG